MKSIEIKIKTINPIIIAQNSGDRNMLVSKDYIPGSSLLGIFASEFIRKNNLGIDAHKNPIFDSWFLKGDIIFSDSFIFDKERYFPTPLSIRKEKSNENKIYDLLFNKPDKQTKLMSAFSKKVENYISKIEVNKEISFHHARDWETGASQKTVIFNYENIKENQIFVGNIIGDEEKINEFYNTFPHSFFARLGKSKNSQYGKIGIELSEPKNYEQEFKNDFEPKDKEKVVMTCLSDTIIYNENGFSTTNKADIEKYLGIKIIKAFLKQSRNEQFVGIWKLKKQSENVISAGSCFLLEKIPENYKELQKFGFGERTNEGFGRIVFGYQTDGEIKYFEDKKNEPTKPKTKIPEFLKDIVKKIIIEKLFELEVSSAIEKASRFKELPSKSLLGKLQLMTRDIENFETNLEKVVKNNLAKQQLNRSHNKNKALLDFIQEKANFENSINIPTDIENLFQILNLSKTFIENKRDIFKQKFLETFFNSMRKRERKNEK